MKNAKPWATYWQSGRSEATCSSFPTQLRFFFQSFSSIASSSFESWLEFPAHGVFLFSNSQTWRPKGPFFSNFQPFSASNFWRNVSAARSSPITSKSSTWMVTYNLLPFSCGCWFFRVKVGCMTSHSKPCFSLFCLNSSNHRLAAVLCPGKTRPKRSNFSRFFHKSFLSLWLPHHQKRICHIYCPEVQIDIHQKNSENDEAWGARWRTQMLVQKPYLERLATCTAAQQALHDETNLLSLGGVSMSPLLWLWWCRIPHPILHSPQQGWAPPSWSAFLLPRISWASAFRSISDSIFGGWSSSSFTKSSHSKKNSSSAAISTSSSPSGNSTKTLLFIFSSSLQPRHEPFSAS